MADSNSEQDQEREPHIDWSRHEDIPVLTDIVDPDDAADAGPYVVPEDRDEAPSAPPARVGFDDDFGVEEAEAAGMAALPEPALLPEELPADEPPAVSLDDLHAALAAELDDAAARIVAESVEGVEALLADRIAQRLKDEIGGIVGVALAEFERQRKQ